MSIRLIDENAHLKRELAEAQRQLRDMREALEEIAASGGTNWAVERARAAIASTHPNMKDHESDGPDICTTR